MTIIAVILLPLLAAVLFAVAAALHYGTAVMHGAKDLPNLPMAIVGGAVAGALAVLLALGAFEFFGTRRSCLQVGVIFAGLAGEYLGGRAEYPSAAMVRGTLCALIMFPAGTALMAALLGQVA